MIRFLPGYCGEKRDKGVPEAHMSRPNPVILTAFLAMIVLVMGGAAVLKGGLYIDKHDGDAMHLMEIVFRMAEGQVPHLDFMTPIGALAFWPVALLVMSGMGVGMAFLWSQVIVAALFLPMVVWVAASRLGPNLALLFGGVVMVLLLALIDGGAETNISVSMHYNRQAWAAAFVAILAALIPPVHPRVGQVDGIIIGLMMVLLAMVKVTYFAAFALPVALALVMTEQRRALGWALGTGLAAFTAITLFLGPGIWPAYMADLATVAGSEVRAAPGDPLTAVMGAPAYLGGSLVALGGVILLRQARMETGGLILLLLVPGFFYVTYQNYGNDPKWLMLVAVLLLALRPEADKVLRNAFGWPLRDALGVAAAMALALSLASYANLAYSPLRHLRVDPAEYVPLLPRARQHADLQVRSLRFNRVDARVALDGPGTGLERYRPLAERETPPTFMGENLKDCTLELGLQAVMDAITRDLEGAGLADGRSILAADLFSSFWLFGALDPLEGGAPWYYGGLPGWENADYLLVPSCPRLPQIRDSMIEEFKTRGITDELTEIRRTPLYTLYGKG